MKKFAELLRLVLEFSVLGCLFFPVFFAVAVACDWLFASSGYLLEIIHQSKNYHIQVFKQDWLKSLPLAVFIAFVLVAPIGKASYLTNRISPAQTFMLRMVIVFILAIGLYHTFITGIVLFVVTALLLAGVAWCIRLVYAAIHLKIQC